MRSYPKIRFFAIFAPTYCGTKNFLPLHIDTFENLSPPGTLVKIAKNRPGTLVKIALAELVWSVAFTTIDLLLFS